MKTLLRKEDLIFNPPQLGCVLSLTGLPGGGSTIYDRSPYGNIGTITGATWVRLPSGLWCLSFDGTDDYISITDNSSLDLVNAVTTEQWVCPSVTLPTEDKYLVCKGADKYMMQHRSSGLFRLYIAGATIDINSTTQGLANTWYHVVGTYNKVTAYVYVNGVQENSVASNTAIDTDNNNLTIGAFPLGLTSDFAGKIALIRVYNRALTALEIQNLFNREKHLFGVW